MEHNFNFCPKCGYQNPANNNFCARCGERLKNVASITGQARPQPAPAMHPAGQPAAQSAFAKRQAQPAGVQQQPAFKRPPAPQQAEPQIELFKCPACGQPNPPDAEFCKGCSIPITKDVTCDFQSDVAVLTINMDQLDFENHRVLAPIFKAIMKKKILIDLTNVSWMDSTGIGTLVSQVYRCARTGQEIKIVGMNAKIHAAVKALQVDNVLEIYPDINAARVVWGLPPV